MIDQCNSEIPCNTENKSIINQLKAQGNEASQIIINLQHERDANLNKLNVMLSNIEEMESEMRFTKELLMKTKDSGGRRWKKYHTRLSKKKTYKL